MFLMDASKDICFFIIIFDLDAVGSRAAEFKH